MLWKSRNKKVGLGVMVVMSGFILATLWAVLATPGTALAKKPGDDGNDPVCFELDFDGGGRAGFSSALRSSVAATGMGPRMPRSDLVLRRASG